MKTVTLAPIRADINVTPLVDVVLVLLIIFMLATPLFNDHVRLPSTAHPVPRPDQPGKLLITIAADHTVSIDGHSLPPTELRERLKRTYADAPSSEIVIKADAALSYGDVKRALLEVRDAGFGRAGLITTPSADRGASAEPGGAS